VLNSLHRYLQTGQKEKEKIEIAGTNISAEVLHFFKFSKKIFAWFMSNITPSFGLFSQSFFRLYLVRPLFLLVSHQSLASFLSSSVPSIRLFVRSFIHLFIHSSIHPSIHPSIHSFICSLSLFSFIEQIANGPSRPTSPSADIALDIEEPPPMEMESIELLVNLYAFSVI